MTLKFILVLVLFGIFEMTVQVTLVDAVLKVFRR